MSTAAPSTSAPQGSSGGAYTAKAHEFIPEFSGKAIDYKEYRKRLMLYDRKMDLAGRKKETAFNVLSSLKGRAWDSCEDLSMEQLEGENGMTEILRRLDTVFKFDAITELPNDFESFFIILTRKRHETMQEYMANFERQLRKLAAHEVQLPDKVIGWYFLRRAGLSQNQRQMIMSTITTATLSLDTVRKAVNFVIGQDQTPDGGGGSWRKNDYRSKDSIYAMTEESYDPSDVFLEEDDSWEVGPDDSVSQVIWEDDAVCFEQDEAEAVFVAEDAASEYDDIMANYVEARQKLNQMRVSRGYYPVVAMIPEQKNYSSPGGKGGKSKSRGKGGGKQKGMKQGPKPPQIKARGKAALGSTKCLRCGQAGHQTAACPVSKNKRKAEDDSLDVNMVEDDPEVINIFDEDGTESEPDDTAMFDSGAASCLIGTVQLKRYLKVLMMRGFCIHDMPAWRCAKGLRFGNGNRDVTSLCVLVPTFFKGRRRDILMYVINGSTPCLLGRPALEAFGIAIKHATKEIAWNGEEKYEPACLGPKGEYIVHMAEDLTSDHVLHDRPPDQVFLPVDFDEHVFEQVPLTQLIQADDGTHLVEEEFDSSDKPSSSTDQVSLRAHLDDDAPREPVPPVMVFGNAQTAECDQVKRDDDLHLDKLPSGKLNKLYYETIANVKETDNLLNKAKDLENYFLPKTYVIWEVYAGEGRITKTANRRVNCRAERFSKEDGWDFSLPAHRRAFFNRMEKEKPDAVLWSPVCKLWSNMQELTCAKDPAYAANLEARRREDHDSHLTFVAVGYEKQRREGRIGLVEHPWTSKAWKTPAFEHMKGYDTYIDMCAYGLVLPAEDGHTYLVQKPTCLKVTSPIVYNKLWRTCDGSHWHTHLEGQIPGMGTRTSLAENYTQEFATKVINAILAELYSLDNINVQDDLAEEMSRAVEEQLADVETDPVKSNRLLRSRVGGRAVDYVQRLHKNLGHCGSEVLVRMLREVQATDDVLTAAKEYTCPLCYARKPPKQSPPASTLKCTQFNDRILVDSHWILNDDGIVAVREPAPGTPAAKKKEKAKSENVPPGRRCVLTVVDHATRYCAIRILNSEKAEEFTKGLERCWFRHFGPPKMLRIDEAKGWASKHVRECLKFSLQSNIPGLVLSRESTR